MVQSWLDILLALLLFTKGLAHVIFELEMIYHYFYILCMEFSSFCLNTGWLVSSWISNDIISFQINIPRRLIPLSPSSDFNTGGWICFLDRESYECILFFVVKKLSNISGSRPLLNRNINCAIMQISISSIGSTSNSLNNGSVCAFQFACDIILAAVFFCNTCNLFRLYKN